MKLNDTKSTSTDDDRSDATTAMFHERWREIGPTSADESGSDNDDKARLTANAYDNIDATTSDGRGLSTDSDGVTITAADSFAFAESIRFSDKVNIGADDDSEDEDDGPPKLSDTFEGEE